MIKNSKKQNPKIGIKNILSTTKRSPIDREPGKKYFLPKPISDMS